MMKLRLASLLVSLLLSGVAQAQENPANYPSRPIRIVVGNAAGGGTDTIARLIGPKLSEKLGQPVVVENKPGGNNIIAVQTVTKAPPDGHTLLAGTMGMLTINPALYPSLPYDTLRDLVPVSIVCSYPMVLAVNADAPIRNVPELVAYLKAHPDKANAGGTGSVYQVTTKLFEMRTGSKTQFVTYRSHNDSMIGLMRGDTLMALVDMGPATGPLKDGRIRALAVTADKRVPSWPDVPTIAEAGVKDMDLELWTGLLAPAGTPPAIVTRIRNAVMEIVRTDEMREKMKNLEILPVGSTSEAYKARLAKEIAMWAGVVKAGNIKAEQ